MGSRASVRVWLVVVAASASVSVAATGTATAQTPAGCGGDLLADGRVAESERYVVVYRTSPSPVRVGEHFVVDLAVCTKPGAQPPIAVRIDATMPEHRHGMNYRPTVRRSSPGRWRAEGLLFHMPGRWEFAFQVHDGRRDDRVAAREDVR